VDRHLEQLNPAQREAVTTTEGPLLVLAGAGTGKTRVITERIAHLMSRRVPARAILAVTFTNKAAQEMRERVGRAVGSKRAKDLTVGTFHAFCARLLRERGAAIGVPKDFAICDASDQMAAVKGVLRELHVPEASLSPASLQARISLHKNRLAAAAQVLEGAADDDEELLGRAWQRYEEHLRRSRRLDFDDLLVRAVELVGVPEVRTALGERFRYVLVDEFQDTNAPQYEVVRAIAKEHRNLCVVGDDDQSIYGWRGADVSKILGFARDFPGAKVVRLETNYRSTQAILDAANKLIVHNPKRHEKVLRSAQGEGERVRAYRLEDETAEADYIVLEMQELVRRTSAQWRDFAILFRTQTQPRAFEVQLRARGVPYVLVGGMSFFDRKEVRDVLAYLKLLANPGDESSFLRILNCPPRGIGKGSIERALAAATERGVSVVDVFARPQEVAGLSSSAVAGVDGLRGVLASLGAKDPGKALVRRIEELLEAVGYRGEIDRCYPDPKQREDRWAAVLEVLDFAQNFVARTAQPTLAGFLEELALTADDRRSEGESTRDAVTLMTLHSAKGLEFPRVYLVGFEEGLLPHARSVHDDVVEEERRLAYVGITRARRVLTITYCERRARHGRAAPCHPSRFLFEIQGEPPPKGWAAAGELAPREARGRGRRAGGPAPGVRKGGGGGARDGRGGGGRGAKRGGRGTR